ncbi:hypothetical protein Vafri_4004, partial [Volvox africanus]
SIGRGAGSGFAGKAFGGGGARAATPTPAASAATSPSPMVYGMDALASAAAAVLNEVGDEEVEEEGVAPPVGGAQAAVGWRIRCIVPPPDAGAGDGSGGAEGAAKPAAAPSFSCLITSYDESSGTHAVELETGVAEVLTLSQLRVSWLGYGDAAREAHSRRVAAHRAQLGVEDEAAAAAAAAAERRRNAPSEIPIVCNGVLGTFMTASGLVRTQGGKSISPSEFERLAGKAASKKWKVTLRVIKPSGQLGPTLGEHLVELGLEEPAAPRVPSHLAQAIANLDALRRRHGLAR